VNSPENDGPEVAETIAKVVANMRQAPNSNDREYHEAALKAVVLGLLVWSLVFFVWKLWFPWTELAMTISGATAMTLVLYLARRFRADAQRTRDSK
jgi:hypothetical protein